MFLVLAKKRDLSNEQMLMLQLLMARPSRDEDKTRIVTSVDRFSAVGRKANLVCEQENRVFTSKMQQG